MVLQPRTLGGSNKWKPQFWSLILLWCRLKSLQVDPSVGFSQGSGKKCWSWLVAMFSVPGAGTVPDSILLLTVVTCRLTWLFLQIEGFFCGCPYHKSLNIWGLCAPIFGNSHMFDIPASVYRLLQVSLEYSWACSRVQASCRRLLPVVIPASFRAMFGIF